MSGRRGSWWHRTAAPAWWSRRRIDCAWCKALIERGGLRALLPGAKISHGICTVCSAKSRAEMRVAKLDRAKRAQAVALSRVPYSAALLFFAIAILGCEQRQPAAAPTYHPQRHRAIAVTWSAEPSDPTLEMQP